MLSGPEPRELDQQGDLILPAETPAAMPSSPETPETGKTGAVVSLVQALGYTLAAALVAGLLTWGIGEQTYDYYRPSAKAFGSREFITLNREKGIANQKNTVIAFGTYGALLGMLSGAAGGALRRSIPGMASAALLGLLLGAIGAGLASYLLAPIFGQFFNDETPSLLLPFLVRGGIWSLVGMAAGLAFGCGLLGSRGIPRALIGGLVASICGTVAFELVNALLFPGDRNDAVIPSSVQARLLAYLFVSVSVAIGIVLFGRPRMPETSTISRSFS